MLLRNIFQNVHVHEVAFLLINKDETDSFDIESVITALSELDRFLCQPGLDMGRSVYEQVKIPFC